MNKNPCGSPAARLAASALGLSCAVFTSVSMAQAVERAMTRPMQPRALPVAATGGQAPAAASGDQLPRLACTSVTTGDPLNLMLGKSRLVQLQPPAIRVLSGGRAPGAAGTPMQAATPAAPAMPGVPAPGGSGGSDGVADTEITLLSPTELLVTGRRPGSGNVILQDREGRCVVRDITVTVDPQTLEGTLRQLIPSENGVRVAAADSAIILTGDVRDVATLDRVMTVADVYSNGRRIVNLMRVSAPQQVMLEVKIAEVSKSLLDRFGLDAARAVTSGGYTNFIQGIIGGQSALLGRFGPNVPGTGAFTGAASLGVATPGAAAAAAIANPTRGSSLLGIDVSNRDGIFRVLAEPNIMAISGQSAAFLSGGKIFIPVAQENNRITLEEKEFGVGLRFTPTVLDGRINLKVVSEVSELSQSGTPFTTIGNITAVLPSMTTRRVDTTVQLADGQSFAVAGLIRNNVTEALDKFPGLGEAPVVGALFRSTEFQNDLTELLFVITPRLVRPVIGQVTLPTDNHVMPTRADVILRGAGEGRLPPEQRTPATPVPLLPPSPPAANPQPARPLGPTSGLSGQNEVIAMAAPRATLPAPQPLAPIELQLHPVPGSLDEQPHFD